MTFTRASLGCVKPLVGLDQYKSNVECHFLEFWVKAAKMTLKVTVNYPHFQNQLRVSQDPCLVQIWWFQPKFVMSYLADKPNFLEFWTKMAKMTLKVKVDEPHFQKQLRVWCTFGANLVILAQICDELSCTQGKVYRQMDRRRQWQYSFGLKNQGMKIKI